MTVTLVHQIGAIGARDHRAFNQPGRVGSQAHGAAKVSGPLDEGLLLLHRGDHRMGGLRVELGGRCIRDTENILGVLDDHALQPQADTQRRHPPDPGPGQRAELAFDAANTEAAGDDDGVHSAQCLLCPGLGLALVAGDPADRDLGVMVEATGAHGLGDRQIGVRQVDVLAHEGDLDGVLGVVHPA